MSDAMVKTDLDTKVPIGTREHVEQTARLEVPDKHMPVFARRCDVVAILTQEGHL